MCNFTRTITRKKTKGNNSKKINNFFLKFSPGNLFIILYQLYKVEAPSGNRVWDIKLSISYFSNGNNSKIYKNTFYKKKTFR